jgi:hypothetical protein
MYHGGREKETKRRKGRRGREEGGERERERERERESKVRWKRDANIPHFLRKMNYALSFADRRERGEGD